MEPVIIIHGGAGQIHPSRYEAKLKAVKDAVRVGYGILKQTDNPVDAVEAAVRLMEDNEECNAGWVGLIKFHDKH
jgi:isoaspartyl peptidase/L-asparaginase-like protein (Ntn-hydrolase superfamily)